MDWKKIKLLDIKPLKNWWQQREPREQWLLVACAVILVIFGSYRIYASYIDSLITLENSIIEKQQELAWIQEQKNRLLNIQTQGGLELSPIELSKLVTTVLDNWGQQEQSTLTADEEDIKVLWNGVNPSNFMKALSQISISGADIIDFQFERQNSNSQITVIINN